MDEELRATLAQLVTAAGALHADVKALRNDVRAIDTRLSAQIADVDARLTAQIADVDARLSAQIADVDARLTAQIKEVDTRLSAQIAGVDARLTAQITEVDTRLGAQIEQVRQVTSVNHYKVIGRIEQVASMLAEHMVDTHDPGDHRKRA
jgi:DNA anti-recombination protein RmuC